LNKARYADKKLAWGREESEDEIFFTPPESPLKEDTNGSVVLNNGQTHLEVNGVIHSYIANQLKKLAIVQSLRLPPPRHSRSKDK
jgi:hypothetical protein